ncbi:MAG: hypothetical protein HY820_35760 [Acidobacteria bacterium]|nr:hypothetical protein [Acidobacteriota bacterium]
MIAIHFDPANLDQEQKNWWTEWQLKSTAATDRVIDAFEGWMSGKPTKAFQFDFQNEVWKKLKDWLLEKIFHNKCAYCEREISGYYGDAEHYRPKGAVKFLAADGTFGEPQFQLFGKDGPSQTLQPHPGYFWLAYDWRNLIPACVYCNSGEGKNERFDLGNGRIHLVLVALGADKVVAMAVEERPRESKKWPGYYYLTPQLLDGRENPLLLNPLNPAPDRDPRKHIRFGVRGIAASVSGSPYGKNCIETFQLRNEKLRQKRQKAQETFRSEYYDALRRTNPEDMVHSEALVLLDQYNKGEYPFSAAALDYLDVMRRMEAVMLQQLAGEET